MLRSKLFIGGPIITLLLVLTACSSTGTLEVIQTKTEAIGVKKTVSLNIVHGAKVESIRITKQLKSDLFGRLVAEGIFRQVVHENESADYKLNIRVLEASAVSPTARILLGLLAGSNKLSCDVKLVDQATGKVKTAFVATGKSASHPMSSESGLDDAVREAVSNIILGLR